MRKQGIDVSYVQGAIDWSAVTADFAMIRACYGWDNDRQIDSRLYENARGAKENGTPYGLFHYSYARTPDDALKEADFFLRVIKGLKPEYPVAYDFEEPFQIGGSRGGISYAGMEPAQQLAIIDAFLQRVEQVGYFAAIYMPAAALTRLYRYAPARIARYAVWVAHIGAASPAYPGNVGIWQYSWTGRVPGIAVDVDLDYAYQDFPAIIRAAGLNHLDPLPEPEPNPEPEPDPEPNPGGGCLIFGFIGMITGAARTAFRSVRRFFTRR